MVSLISKLLLKLPPETAHSIALLFLKIFQILFWYLFPKKTLSKISIKVPPHHQLKIRSRLGLAAGFDKQAEVFPALSYLGFSFIEVGTVTPKAQPGNPKPRIWRVAPQSLINHLGFNSEGLTVFESNIRKLKARALCPVLANIGKNKETTPENALQDYEACLSSLNDCVDGFVINVSSPNTPGLRDLQSIPFLSGLVPLLPNEKPSFLKLSPDISLEQLKELCEFIKREPKLGGVVLTNTSRSLAEKRGFSAGGVSGPPLLSLSLDFVEEAKEILKKNKTIIGVGGISSPEDAQKMIRAGADLIEIYTAFVYQGPQLIREINQVLR